MCPGPSLLVAYLDETLFHRDAAAIEQHLEQCAECTALVAAMRQKRAAEQAAQASRRRMTVGALAMLVVLAGYGLWKVLPGSTSESATETTASAEPGAAPSEAAVNTPPAPTSAAAVAPSPSTTASEREATPQSAATTTPTPTAKPAATATPAAAKTKTTATPAATKTESAAKPAPTAKPRLTAAQRRAARAAARAASRAAAVPRVMWRTRDQIVEQSTDGGMTWVTDHAADRTIRASVFLNENVAWVVGDSGLILRRTQNGWFGASPPADGNITAVKASSPSRATVTLEDGRVFATVNGGVTWDTAP